MHVIVSRPPPLALFFSLSRSGSLRLRLRACIRERLVHRLATRTDDNIFNYLRLFLYIHTHICVDPGRHTYTRKASARRQWYESDKDKRLPLAAEGNIAARRLGRAEEVTCARARVYGCIYAFLYFTRTGSRSSFSCGDFKIAREAVSRVKRGGYGAV